MPSLEQLQPESSGEFTLNPVRAAQHMSRLQLPGPHHYLLKMVQAAVAGGASEIRARVGWFGLELQFDLPQPLRLEAMATGVNAALSSLKTVTLEQQGRRHVYSRKSQWEEVAPFAPGLRIGLVRTRWDCSAELGLLSQLCCWCPVPFILNGRSARIAQWGSSRTRVQSYVPGTALSAPASSRAAIPPRVPAQLAGRRIACDMVLALEPYPSSTVTFIQHGVAICQRKVEFGREGVVAVVGADDLPTDLGGFELIDGPALKERIAAIRVEVEKMSQRT